MTLQDEERFRHDRSRYERPNLKYRCGCGAVWDKPCMLGPSHDGQCGGLYECRPQKRSDNWSCSRPESEGGGCAAGPSPDGTCSQYRPPCVPRRTLRNYRGIMALAALVAVAALIAAFHDVRTLGVGPFGAADAGPLTSDHANFTSKEGCGACHEAHGGGPLQWLAGAFRTSDMTATCLECHSFTGPERNPHNLTLAALGVGAGAASEPRWAVDSLACNACHTEHKGAQADISQLSGAQCATCHKVKFATFDEAHPPFSPNYPHDRRTSIRFDHVKHFNVHFTNERGADVAPDSCVDCHAIAAAERNVPPKGFEESCAACHTTEMAARDMVFLMLPEFFEEPLERDDIRAACGLTPDEFDAVIAGDDPDEIEEDYLSVSDETLSTIGAYLLGVYPDEPDDYGPRMGALILAMAEDGTAPLTDLLAERTSRHAAATMLQGLGAELAQRVACAWGANLEYEAPQEPPAAGWYGDFIELKYRPGGHSDPIVRAWLDFALAAVDQAEDEEDLERAEALRDELIDPKNGVGACTKCHAVSALTTPSSGEDRDACLRVDLPGKYRAPVRRLLPRRPYPPRQSA